VTSKELKGNSDRCLFGPDLNKSEAAIFHKGDRVVAVAGAKGEDNKRSEFSLKKETSGTGKSANRRRAD